MNRFDERVVIVSGAASGIGRATAIRIAAEGGTVACLDVQEQGLQQTLQTIEAAGSGQAIALHCDVSDAHAVQSTVDEVIARFGKLNALCNIAGVLRMQHTLQEDLEHWNRIIGINLTGTFLMCRAALPHLIETRGSIVNMGSTAAIRATPWAAAYAASKGGVFSLTKVLALEFATRGVNVNSVSPASVITPMSTSNPLPAGADHRLLAGILPIGGIMREASDVASLIAFLASDDAVHINGVDIPVDGGICA